jgi:hypothetical protein
MFLKLTLHAFYFPACYFQILDKYRLCCCLQCCTSPAYRSHSCPASAFVDLRRFCIWYNFSAHSQRTFHDKNFRNPCNERHFSPDPKANYRKDCNLLVSCKRVSRIDADVKNILDSRQVDLVAECPLLFYLMRIKVRKVHK